jgi:hypothetical protein
MLVSTAHWRYMTLRRLGRDEEARAVLESITADMEIIENQAYHQLCLFYKGELEEGDLQGDGSSPANAAIAYGVANWHLANGDTERGTELLEEIVAQDGWAAFGSIAAEADLARMQNEELGIRNFHPPSHEIDHSHETGFQIMMFRTPDQRC